MTRLLARWIFPVDQPPIERGLVEFDNGIITAVEPLAGTPDGQTKDLGNVAIIPGLVNAHAHLEFSSLDVPIEPALPFTDWIGRLLAHRRERPGSLNEYINSGTREASQSGTSVAGDIVTGNWSPKCLPSNGPRIVAFRELIGLLPDQMKPQLDIARQHLTDCRSAKATGQSRLAPAISPHAPYSVSPDLFQALIDLAKTENVPLCIHLAETLAELELLESGTGEFRDMLTHFDLWRDGIIPKHSRPMDYLQPLADIPHALIAHGNYLADDEIDFLAKHPNISTVFCPRTHDFFSHTNHPWQRLLDTGASVCIGTDGRSSSPDYSLWSELQFLARLTNGQRLPQILELGTRMGATALGLEAGTITVGQRADLTMISLGEESTTDSWEALFAPKARPVATILDGVTIRRVRSQAQFRNDEI